MRYTTLHPHAVANNDESEESSHLETPLAPNSSTTASGEASVTRQASGNLVQDEESEVSDPPQERISNSTTFVETGDDSPSAEENQPIPMPVHHQILRQLHQRLALPSGSRIRLLRREGAIHAQVERRGMPPSTFVFPIIRNQQEQPDGETTSMEQRNDRIDTGHGESSSMEYSDDSSEGRSNGNTNYSGQGQENPRPSLPRMQSQPGTNVRTGQAAERQDRAGGNDTENGSGSSSAQQIGQDIRRPSITRIQIQPGANLRMGPVAGRQGRGIRGSRFPGNARGTTIRLNHQGRPGILRGGSLRAGSLDQSPQTRQVRLPALQPLVLPDSQQNFKNNEQNEHLERFVCQICCEFLDKPSSCGQCSSRFCFDCLQKVLQTGNPNSEKLCPTCRKPLLAIQQDHDLSREMQAVGMIPCRFEGCSGMLPLDRVRQHEKNHCPFVQMACRYQSFGCGWKGRRGELRNHEAECTLFKVSALVDEVRTVRELYQQSTSELSLRIQALNLMVEHQRENAGRQNRHSVSNPVHVVYFVLSVLCASPWVLRTRDLWLDLHQTPERRASVFNFTTLAPTFVLVFRLMLIEYWKCAAILRSPSFAFSTMEESKRETLIDSLVVFLILEIVAVLIVVSFYLDGQSSVNWRTYKIRGVEGRFMLHVVTAAYFLLFYLVFDLTGGSSTLSVTATALFLLIIVSSSVLSSVIASFSSILSRGTNQISPIPAGRALLPLLFGLRFGFVAHLSGPKSCLDALVILRAFRMVQRHLKIGYSSLRHQELFFSYWPGSVYAFYAGLSLAYEAHAAYYARDFKVDFVLAAMFLFTSIELAEVLSKLSAEIGRLIHRQAEQILTRNNRSTGDQGSVGIGLAVLALYAFCLTALAVL